MNLFKENRWLHLMLYIGLSILWTHHVFESLNSDDIVGRVSLNLVFFGILALGWEIYFKKIDGFDILWSVIGAFCGTILAVFVHHKKMLDLSSGILIITSIIWWYKLKSNFLKKKKHDQNIRKQ